MMLKLSGMLGTLYTWFQTEEFDKSQKLELHHFVDDRAIGLLQPSSLDLNIGRSDQHVST